jgi:hypothetical protein
MAVTITAYQQPGGFIRVNPGETKNMHWNPSNDIRRDKNDDNKCVLIWTVDPSGSSNARVEVSINGQPIDTTLVDGARRTVTSVFFSDKANTGGNTFSFDYKGGGTGEISISDVVVFYKRLVEGV